MPAGKLAAVVIDDDTVLWGPWMSFAMAESLADALRTLKARELGSDLGLTAAEVGSLLNPELEFRTVEPRDEGSEADEATSAIAVIVMFAAIIAYGQWIGYSVADEKGSRVVELILGAVPPRQLLTGKLLAVGSMGLAQMTGVGVLVVGYGLAANLVNLPDFTLGLVPWMLVWFLLGFGFYGAIYAAGGSLVNDTHEASSTLGVLNIVPIVGYVFGIIASSQGTDTTLLRVFSLIPVWAPMTMPSRIARGWAVPWEVGLSVVFMLLAIYGVIWIAGRVYFGGVARATSKLSWRAAFRAGRDLGHTG
jgi:ABC-2 type transport system permease protein